MKKIVIILLTCAAVVLPIVAQDKDSVLTDSVKTETVISNGQKENVKSDMEDSDTESNSGDGMLIAILVISVLSLLISTLTLLQNHKKMNRKNVNIDSDIEGQIANMQQQLLQMKKFMEEILVKQSSLLGEFVAKLGTVQQIPVTGQSVQNDFQQPVRQSYSDESKENHVHSNVRVTSKDKNGKPAVQEQKIYVRPSMDGANVILTPVSETHADRATFIVKALGNKGTYIFNKAAKDSVVNYLDTMLTPYCDCSLETNGNVTNMDTKEEGTVEKQGDKWLVIEKAQIVIS